MKKMMIILLVAVLVLSIALAGCSGGSVDSGKASDSGEAASGEKKTIGYALYWVSEYAQVMNQGIEEEAKKQDVNVKTLNAEGDPVKQKEQIEQFISEGVDSIIIAAVDVYSLDDVIKKAKEAGIPVVGVNMYIVAKDESSKMDAYAGPDDVRAGEMEIEWLVAQNPNAKIAIIEGADGYSATDDRRTGIENGLKANPTIEVLVQKTGKWDRNEAMKLTENWIQSHGDELDAIVAHDDEMAMGAIQALENAGMKDKIMVLGIDGMLESCIAVQEGRQDYSVFQDGELEGELAVQLACQLMKGEEPEQREIFIEMFDVTKSNAQEFIDLYAERGIEREN
jgi:ABC-type sugar transport system substrate-binding protein